MQIWQCSTSTRLRLSATALSKREKASIGTRNSVANFWLPIDPSNWAKWKAKLHFDFKFDKDCSVFPLNVYARKRVILRCQTLLSDTSMSDKFRILMENGRKIESFTAKQRLWTFQIEESAVKEVNKEPFNCFLNGPWVKCQLKSY